MNCVDSLVKRCLLNYPSIFPTRVHVLAHALLGNGNDEWVEHDGLLYLKQSVGEPEERDTIKLNQPIEGFDGLTPDQKLDNNFRLWIQDNIDEYCLSTFYHNHTSYLLPRARYYMVSRGWNRFDDLETFENIAPEWLDAMLEVCEHFMTDIAQLYGGSPYLDCLSAIKCPMFKDYYSFLQTHRNTIKALPAYVNQDQWMNDFTNELLDEISKDEKE